MHPQGLPHPYPCICRIIRPCVFPHSVDPCVAGYLRLYASSGRTLPTSVYNPSCVQFTSLYTLTPDAFLRRHPAPCVPFPPVYRYVCTRELAKPEPIRSGKESSWNSVYTLTPDVYAPHHPPLYFLHVYPSPVCIPSAITNHMLSQSLHPRQPRPYWAD